MKEHKYVPITLGWTVKRNTGELQGNVSYRNITAENTVHDPDEYTIIHTITIENNTVFLNGKYIVGAPAGKTKAFKEKFCKAVVWSLLNDDQGLKDKLKEIGFVTVVPEPEIDNTVEYNNGIDIGRMYEDELFGYPSAEVTFDLTYDQALRSEIELSNIEADLNECCCNNPLDEGFDNHEYDNIEMEFYWSDLIKEMWTAATKPKIPVFPAGYLPYLNVTIIEECVA